MATNGTPHQGRDQIIAPRVYTGLTLILYVNLPDSLDDESVYADLVQPTGSGYAPVPLNGVFASADGVVTYDHGTTDYIEFQNTHASVNWWQPVTGAAIIGGAGPYLLHFHDMPAPLTMMPGQKLGVDIANLVSP